MFLWQLLQSLHLIKPSWPRCCCAVTKGGYRRMPSRQAALHLRCEPTLPFPPARRPPRPAKPGAIRDGEAAGAPQDEENAPNGAESAPLPSPQPVPSPAARSPVEAGPQEGQGQCPQPLPSIPASRWHWRGAGAAPLCPGRCRSLRCARAAGAAINTLGAPRRAGPGRPPLPRGRASARPAAAPGCLHCQSEGLWQPLLVTTGLFRCL